MLRFAIFYLMIFQRLLFEPLFLLAALYPFILLIEFDIVILIIHLPLSSSFNILEQILRVRSLALLLLNLCIFHDYLLALPSLPCYMLVHKWHIGSVELIFFGYPPGGRCWSRCSWAACLKMSRRFEFEFDIFRVFLFLFFWIAQRFLRLRGGLILVMMGVKYIGWFPDGVFPFSRVAQREQTRPLPIFSIWCIDWALVAMIWIFLIHKDNDKSII